MRCRLFGDTPDVKRGPLFFKPPQVKITGGRRRVDQGIDPQLQRRAQGRKDAAALLFGLLNERELSAMQATGFIVSPFTRQEVM